MRALRLIGALAAALLIVGVAGATHYPAGYVNGDGYTYNYIGNVGYWYYGGVPYTREYTAGYYYYQYGVQYYQPGYYTYSRYYEPAQPTVSPKDPGWRSQLLKIASQRDKVEGEIRKGAHEQQWFMDAVKALGLEQNFHWNGYGAAPPVGAYYGTPGVGAGYGSLQLGAHGALGNTVYGYNAHTITNLYGDVNLPQLYQQAARLTQNAQDLAKQATGDFSTLVGKEGDNRARALEILARAAAARDVLNALQPKEARVETKETIFKVMPPAPDGPVVDPGPTPAPPGGLKAPGAGGGVPQKTARAKLRDLLIRQDCISCHQGASAKAKLDLSDYGRLDAAAKRSVVARLVTEDADKRMPRSADGGPGRHYTVEEAALFAD